MNAVFSPRDVITTLKNTERLTTTFCPVALYQRVRDDGYYSISLHSF